MKIKNTEYCERVERSSRRQVDGVISAQPKQIVIPVASNGLPFPGRRVLKFWKSERRIVLDVENISRGFVLSAQRCRFVASAIGNRCDGFDFTLKEFPGVGVIFSISFPEILCVFLKALCVFPEFLCVFLKVLCVFTASLCGLLKALCVFPASLCGLLKALCVFTESLCGLLKALCVFPELLCGLLKALCEFTESLCELLKVPCVFTKSLCELLKSTYGLMNIPRNGLWAHVSIALNDDHDKHTKCSARQFSMIFLLKPKFHSLHFPCGTSADSFVPFKKNNKNMEEKNENLF